MRKTMHVINALPVLNFYTIKEKRLFVYFKMHGMLIVFKSMYEQKGIPYLKIVDSSQAYIHQFQNVIREIDVT